MFYRFVKIIARTAFRFYCRDLQLNNKELLKQDGPLLLACNHPNSFLDAIILCTIFDKPVYSLARGDAFKGKLFTRILTAFKMLPVYRVSEGVENLEENYKTFDACKEIFKQNGIVLIFSEGLCVNEWHLRSLKKGTARLALSCWEDGIPLKVLPVAINYNSFRKFGKNLRIYFGEMITANNLQTTNGYGRSLQQFNQLLQQQLTRFVFEITETDTQKLHDTFYIPQPVYKKIILILPAIAGWIIHAPLYIPVKKCVLKKLSSTDHFDSMVVAILFISYPFYLLLLCVLLFAFIHTWYALILILFVPATAWCYVQLKGQLD
ncbi:MAG: 1-acyl-sn-glycerol-3-phosphate acyltransferase [Ferruginibacter sp.]